jgi:hypothetical protein
MKLKIEYTKFTIVEGMRSSNYARFQGIIPILLIILSILLALVALSLRDEKNKDAEVIEWFLSHGGKISKLELIIKEDGQRGLVATQTIYSGESLIFTPRRLFLCLSNAADDFRNFIDDNRHNFDNITDKYEKEKLFLELLLIHEAFVKRESSFWQPYIESLPDLTIDHLHFLYANQDELNFTKKHDSLKNLVDNMFDMVHQLHNLLHHASQVRPDFFPPDKLGIQEDGNNVVNSMDICRWAAYVVHTRSYSIIDHSKSTNSEFYMVPALMPIVDWANYRNKGMTMHHASSITGGLNDY